MTAPGPDGGAGRADGGGSGAPGRARVLHVVVGHGVAGYFVNAVRSVRACAPADDLLVVDNASPDPDLRRALRAFGEGDEQVEVILRDENDVAANAKVGSLYAACEEAFRLAVARGYTLVHLLQGDMQLLYWDDEVVERALALFAAHPGCVNIQTVLFSRDKALTDELTPSGTPGVLALRRYGLTDTGLYHLGRWQERGMSFGPSEQGHARRYREEGLEVLCHPWPTDAPIPWPPVVRAGVQVGKEVVAHRPFLLRPPTPEAVGEVKASGRPVWLEDLCVPWGWSCLTPMWVTGVDSMDYWVLRVRDARRNGPGRLVPRLERRGVDPGMSALLRAPFRPSLARLLLAAPLGELARRWRALRAGGRRGA